MLFFDGFSRVRFVVSAAAVHVPSDPFLSVFFSCLRFYSPLTHGHHGPHSGALLWLLAFVVVFCLCLHIKDVTPSHHRRAQEFEYRPAYYPSSLWHLHIHRRGTVDHGTQDTLLRIAGTTHRTNGGSPLLSLPPSFPACGVRQTSTKREEERHHTAVGQRCVTDSPHSLAHIYIRDKEKKVHTTSSLRFLVVVKVSIHRARTSHFLHTSAPPCHSLRIFDCIYR
jgi:hypothetical protein